MLEYFVNAGKRLSVMVTNKGYYQLQYIKCFSQSFRNMTM